jgi:hypothetical protein
VASGRSRLRRALLVAVLTVVLAAGAGYAAVRTSTPELGAQGPTTVGGTAASAVFTIDEREIRQVRYRDGGTLDYGFELTNEGRLPVTVTGIDPDQRNSRLFGFVALEVRGGERRFTVPAHGSREVHLLLRMGGCESLSARAGSFASSVLLRTERMGLATGSVRVDLPEEIHTGSPREAFCPNSTAKSRPPG